MQMQMNAYNSYSNYNNNYNNNNAFPPWQGNRMGSRRNSLKNYPAPPPPMPPPMPPMQQNMYNRQMNQQNMRNSYPPAQNPVNELQNMMMGRRDNYDEVINVVCLLPCFGSIKTKFSTFLCFFFLCRTLKSRPSTLRPCCVKRTTIEPKTIQLLMNLIKTINNSKRQSCDPPADVSRTTVRLSLEPLIWNNSVTFRRLTNRPATLTQMTTAPITHPRMWPPTMTKRNMKFKFMNLWTT